MAPSATCPDCSSPLALTNHGSFDAWVCPAGHGLAATLSEAYERAQEDDLMHLWATARGATAAAGARACPMCTRPMVAIDAAVDADEVREGEAGDGPSAHEVPVDVCVSDQVVWFDVGELDTMPADLPDPEPTAEQEAALAEIRATFGSELVAASEGREGFTDRLGDRVAERVRWSPRAFAAFRR